MKRSPLHGSIVVAGRSVVDAHLKARSVLFRDGTIDFETFYGNRWVLPYLGAPLTREGKRTAACPLEYFRFVRGVEVRAGGGVTHTGVAVRQETGRPVMAIDCAGDSREVRAAFSAAGVQHVALGIRPSSTNLVLEYRDKDDPAQLLRLALRERPAQGKSTPGTELDAPRILSGARALLLNSCPDRELVAQLSITATEFHIPQYSVVTNAHPVEDRLWQVKRSVLSLGNHEEWNEVIAGLGLPVAKGNESEVNLEAAAHALSRLMAATDSGDIIDTIGGSGCLAADRATGAVYHVGLREKFRGCLAWQSAGRSGPRVNGLGDRFFASAAAAHLDSRRRPSRVLRAAFCASLRVLAKTLGEAAKVQPNWFDVTVIISPGQDLAHAA